ncbi:MAG: hypothetical protein AABZ53_06290 [Planctomycetota bacterium]
MKPKLRLLTEDQIDPPAPYRFPAPAKPGSKSASPSPDTIAGVEAAMEDAQRRLDNLRALMFPVNPNDQGPRAA